MLSRAQGSDTPLRYRYRSVNGPRVGFLMVLTTPDKTNRACYLFLANRDIRFQGIDFGS